MCTYPHSAAMSSNDLPLAAFAASSWSTKATFWLQRGQWAGAHRWGTPAGAAGAERRRELAAAVALGLSPGWTHSRVLGGSSCACGDVWAVATARSWRRQAEGASLGVVARASRVSMLLVSMCDLGRGACDQGPRAFGAAGIGAAATPLLRLRGAGSSGGVARTVAADQSAEAAHTTPAAGSPRHAWSNMFRL